MFTAAEILDLAMRIEENGRSFYLNAMQAAGDPQLKALLAWIADEEANHHRWFARWQEDLAIAGADPFVAEMTRAVLGDLLERRTFSLEQVDVKDLASADQVLAAALEFERDTVLFYEILAGFVADQTVAAQLRAIIAEEQNHIRQLSEKR